MTITSAPRSSAGHAGSVRIGLFGLGTVGGGVARLLLERGEAIAREVGRPIELRRVVVRDLTKARDVSVPDGILTDDPANILDDPEIDIVVEVMGGIHPTGDWLRQAIRAGKHVVTANKDLVATEGAELLRLAASHGVDIAYEASVGGGIPLIGVFRQDLAANEVQSLHAIINGTTNYILTRMAQDGADYAPALAEAQALGYAESDPTNDVEAIDATYKLAILASLAFRTHVPQPEIYREGITRLRADDFRAAHDLGYVIKLVAMARRHHRGLGEPDAIEVRVHPTLLPRDVLLAGVNGVYNAVHVKGDLVGDVLLYGRGAGSAPTSSAVVADIIDIALNLNAGIANRVPFKVAGDLPRLPIAEVETRYYVRLWVADQPGVLAQIAQAFGDHGISIASCIQKETSGAPEGSAELVIVTHLAREAGMRAALDAFARMGAVREVANVLRIEAP
ncbi:MAG: homoserine dehydrogenase [Chloroflexota bacterium]